MFLMQDPSEVATFTGFISPDNNDRSASNSTLACREAELQPRDRVHWNVFPWWVNITKKGRPVDPTRPAQSFAEARPLAVLMLRSFIGLLRAPKVIVLLGKQAQEGYDSLGLEAAHRSSGICILRCPSCSPQAWNNRDKDSGERNSEITIATLTSARRAALGTPS
ncbi:MAG: uracil-DNA glycosylase family protein [Acidimicrobiales bacterium]